MGELYQALSQMREERDSFEDKKQSAKNEKTKTEEEKELMGKRVVEMVVLRKAQRSSDEESAVDVQEESEEQSVRSARKGQRRGTVERVDLTSRLALFAEKLKDADLARVKLDEEALQFENHKHDVEISESKKDRAERRMEREQANKLELEKFKLMMEMLRDTQKYTIHRLHSLFRSDLSLPCIGHPTERPCGAVGRSLFTPLVNSLREKTLFLTPQEPLYPW